MRAKRGEVRQAVQLPVLQHHRGLRQRQVPQVSRELQEIRTAKVLRSVQAKMRIRQGDYLVIVFFSSKNIPLLTIARGNREGYIY